MTVCVAALFHWNYAVPGQPPEWGVAAVTASDRMLTSSDSQFETTRQKVGHVGDRTVILVAGELTVHSEVISRVMREFKDAKNTVPRDIAAAYGREIQRVKAEQAESLFLAPLGMNSDTFLAQQHEMQEYFVNKITDQLQGYKGDDVDAIVAGSDGESVKLFSVDKYGLVHRQSDIGFAAIGIGGWHASSLLMQSEYHCNVTYPEALAAVYAAKRSAETAPGVGRQTNMHVVLRDQTFEVWEGMQKKLQELYDNYEGGRLNLAKSAIESLRQFIGNPEGANEATRQAGQDAQAHESASIHAPETAQRTESGEEETR